MNGKRIFALVAIAGGLAALVTSAATTGRRPHSAAVDDGARPRRPRAVAPRSPRKSRGFAIDCIRRRRRSSRRAICFGSSAAPAHAPPRRFQPISRWRDTVTPSPPAPSPPPLKLIGIAEDLPDAAGASPHGDHFRTRRSLSREGRGRRHVALSRVSRISSDAVELTDVDRRRHDASRPQVAGPTVGRASKPGVRARTSIA